MRSGASYLLTSSREGMKSPSTLAIRAAVFWGLGMLIFSEFMAPACPIGLRLGGIGIVTVLFGIAAFFVFKNFMR